MEVAQKIADRFPTEGITMREIICTVSGQVAEATNSQTIRISYDRNSYLDPRNTAELLPDSGFFRDGVSRSSFGFLEPLGHVRRERSGIPGEAGKNGATPSGDGHHSDPEDSGIKYPCHVQIVIFFGSVAIVAALWFIGILVASAIKMAVTR